jgi:hypothetical protein
LNRASRGNRLGASGPGLPGKARQRRVLIPSKLIML